jgi:hypothetical protein
MAERPHLFACNVAVHEQLFREEIELPTAFQQDSGSPIELRFHADIDQASEFGVPVSEELERTVPLPEFDRQGFTESIMAFDARGGIAR